MIGSSGGSPTGITRLAMLLHNQPPLAELHSYFVADATPVAAFLMIDTTACGCDT